MTDKRLNKRLYDCANMARNGYTIALYERYAFKRSFNVKKRKKTPEYPGKESLYLPVIRARGDTPKVFL